jgi:hypothetical protein
MDNRIYNNITTKLNKRASTNQELIKKNYYGQNTIANEYLEALNSQGIIGWGSGDTMPLYTPPFATTVPLQSNVSVTTSNTYYLIPLFSTASFAGPVRVSVRLISIPDTSFVSLLCWNFQSPAIGLGSYYAPGPFTNSTVALSYDSTHDGVFQAGIGGGSWVTQSGGFPNLTIESGMVLSVELVSGTFIVYSANGQPSQTVPNTNVGLQNAGNPFTVGLVVKGGQSIVYSII